jgi:acetyl esterase/lipase
MIGQKKSFLANAGLGFCVAKAKPGDMQHYFFTLALILWGMGAWAQQKAKEGRKWAEVMRLPAHFYKLNRPGDLPQGLQKWAYGQHERQYFLCLPPKGGKQAKAAVFFVHGGGWHLGLPEQHLPLADLLNEEGYWVIMPAYRLIPSCSGQELKQDIMTAFVAANQHLRAYLGEHPQWVIGGTSAGANLGALLAFDRENLLRHGLSQKQIKGFFSIVGVLDLAQMPSTKVLKDYAGLHHESSFQQLNPMNYLRPDEHISVLAIHGTKDGLVHYRAALSFVRKLWQMNANLVHWYLIEGGTHLSVGSQWYYKPDKACGQAAILLQWINALQ